MTTYAIDLNFDGDNDDEPYMVDTPDDLDEWFSHMTMSCGFSGYWCAAQLGPVDGDPALLFGLDSRVADGDVTIQGMIKWLPTGEFGYRADAPRESGDVVFDGTFLSAMYDNIAYSPDATQTTGQQAMDAVREYVRTGQRPTDTLQWRYAHEHPVTTSATQQPGQLGDTQ